VAQQESGSGLGVPVWVLVGALVLIVGVAGIALVLLNSSNDEVSVAREQASRGDIERGVDYAASVDVEKRRAALEEELIAEDAAVQPMTGFGDTPVDSGSTGGDTGGPDEWQEWGNVEPTAAEPYEPYYGETYEEPTPVPESVEVPLSYDDWGSDTRTDPFTNMVSEMTVTVTNTDTVAGTFKVECIFFAPTRELVDTKEFFLSPGEQGRAECKVDIDFDEKPVDGIYTVTPPTKLT